MMNQRTVNGGSSGSYTILQEEAAVKSADDTEIICFGYHDSECKKFFYYLFAILTCGLLALVMYWKPEWKIKCLKSRCPLAVADAVLIKDSFGVVHTAEVLCFDADGARIFGSGIASLYEVDIPGDEANHDDQVSLLAGQQSYRRFFDHHHVRYIWDLEENVFRFLSGLESNTKCAAFHEQLSAGLPKWSQKAKLSLYGPNSIAVEVKSYFKLFVEEVLNPFYFFQLMSIALWMSDQYYYYAAAILAISAISMGVSLYEIRQQSETLSAMVASHDGMTIGVKRSEEAQEDIDAKELVPGDVILIPPHGCIMPCDAALVSGNCIVNESMLTGESVPVTKTPLSHSDDDEIYNPDLHKRNTLFCGTHVIQTRYYGQAKVSAVVVRTGFSTAKGDLVRSILFPKPMGFKFYQDAIKFLGFLAVVAACGMVYSIIMMLRNGTSAFKITVRVLDIVTIVIPPALPAAMTVGTVYAQSRLKKADIFCISPARINVCGKIKVVCFDKTGTLTEDGLDLFGVVPLQGKRFLHLVQNPSEMPRGPFLTCMASCHSLTMIDGELTGDPLDLKVFEATNWILEEPGRDTSKFDNMVPTVVKPCTADTFYVSSGVEQPAYEYGIIRQFTFSSQLQRMSVIVRQLGADHMEIFAKGAPEKIAGLCMKETVPEDFHEVLHRYTMQGFRVIATAFKPLQQNISWAQVQRIKRDKVESELRFLGLVIMQNALKPQTTPVIHQLHHANIRTVMITGDNMLTAASVARDCAMVKRTESIVLVQAHPPDGDKPARIEWELADTGDIESSGDETDEQSYHTVDIDSDHPPRYHFAISGKSFSVIRTHFSELVPKLILRGTIFARMSPDQKALLVELLQELDYIVCMCGDGANDCGALKAANAGISLSEAEASVASPFTSKNANIECVPTVIREGRAALVTSFGTFKFMALYSMIQFASVLILYAYKTNLSDFQFLYIDLIITTTVAVLMGHSKAYDHLVTQRPPGSLVNVGNLISILGQIFIQFLFQIGVFVYLTQQPWYVETKGSRTEESVICWELFMVFVTSSYQYLICAYVYSKGPPYRQSLLANLPFLFSLTFLAGFNTFLAFNPFKPINQFFMLIDSTSRFIPFKLTLLGFVTGNFLMSFFLEEVIIPSSAFRAFSHCISRKRQPKNKYKLIERELNGDSEWPPVGQITFGASPLSNKGAYAESLTSSYVN
ncbi:polyamine-transporting ATPase 13A3-like isoform X2 [Lineus longissimus]|uniref:polyamine-transporting ATPase 13A3-like isoform X2 n=1 Tax=Lineus longissimus TaxID=88925 RepID=UPI002B4E00B3